MIGLITLLRSALASPRDHFKTLWNKLLTDGTESIVIDRTGMFAEVRVKASDNRTALLFLPLKPIELVDIPELVNPPSSLLCPYIVLREELIYRDIYGGGAVDIVIQYIPNGEPLYFSGLGYEAVALLDELESECRRVGFSHNKLTSYDIIVSNSGHLHPIRYHFATMDGAMDNFDKLRAEFNEPMVLNDCTSTYTTNSAELFDAHDGVMRFYRDGLYGYMTVDGEEIIPAQYISASDFCERRAVVETEDGYGAIDPTGRVIIRPNLDNLYYDLYDTIFYYFDYDEIIGIDYNGAPIKADDPRLARIKEGQFNTPPHIN